MAMKPRSGERPDRLGLVAGSRNPASFSMMERLGFWVIGRHVECRDGAGHPCSRPCLDFLACGRKEMCDGRR